MCARIVQELQGGVWVVTEQTQDDNCFARLTPDPAGGWGLVVCDKLACDEPCEHSHEEVNNDAGELVKVVDECRCHGC